MRNIQFTYANFRYLMFQADGQYYLLDRRPNHLIGYLFMPLNWLFYQKVYPISNEDYIKIKQRNDKFKHIVIPSVLAAGVGVLFAKTVDLPRYFEMDLSNMVTTILLFLGLILSYVLAQLVYRSRKKSLLSFVHTDISHPIYYKIRPIKLDYRRIMAYIIIFFGLSFLQISVYIYFDNLLFLLGTVLMITTSFLSTNVVFSAEDGYVYKVVDIKVDAEDSIEKKNTI